MNLILLLLLANFSSRLYMARTFSPLWSKMVSKHLCKILQASHPSSISKGVVTLKKYILFSCYSMQWKFDQTLQFARLKTTDTHNVSKSQSIFIMFGLKVSHMNSILTTITFIIFVLNWARNPKKKRLPHSNSCSTLMYWCRCSSIRHSSIQQKQSFWAVLIFAAKNALKASI